MLSYRSRRALRRLCTVLLVLALLVALGLLCWLLWLNRFVIYTKDGVKLDFGISDEFQPGQLAGTQSTENTIQIEFDQTEPTEPPSTELKQLSGYYITLDMLKGDMSSLKEQIAQLPKGTPVMLDVKSIRGEFYYSSNVGNPSSAVSQAGLDDLIAFFTGRWLLCHRAAAGFPGLSVRPEKCSLRPDGYQQGASGCPLDG